MLLTFVHRVRFGLLALAALGGLYGGLSARAQESVQEDGGKPEPVYLEEPTPTPEPTAVREADLTDKYEDGAIRIERHVKQLSDNQIVNHGKFTEYYRDGKKFAEGNFDNGVFEGPWSYWHTNGQLAKTVTFSKGAPNGSWESFRADGSLLAKKAYKMNKREGNWVLYYEDGKTPKIEQIYADGMLSGPRVTYHPNGKPRQKANFVSNQLDGQMEEWDEAGRKFAEANFKAGKLDGKLIRWNADGSVIEQTYRENEIVGVERRPGDGPAPSTPAKSKDDVPLPNADPLAK